jgi:dihydropteroate synthase
MVYFLLVIRLDEWSGKRDRVLVMGVLNATPDSFFPSSRTLSPRLALECAQRMVEDGADIVDIGGESTRPGAVPISVEEELDRVLPLVEKIHAHCDVAVSIDTTKAAVAREALDRGASLINDTSALRADSGMAPLVAERDAHVILMHMQGTPGTMQAAPEYADPVAEVLAFLVERATSAEESGIARERVFIDPGIGFGKRLTHNLALLRNVDRFTATGFPVVIGVSRKSFLGEILGLPVSERLEGTLAAESVAVAYGADILRVHDVKEGRRAADTARLLRK